MRKKVFSILESYGWEYANVPDTENPEEDLTIEMNSLIYIPELIQNLQQLAQESGTPFITIELENYLNLLEINSVKRKES